MTFNAVNGEDSWPLFGSARGAANDHGRLGFRYHSLERLSGASRSGPLLVKSCELARFRRL